MMISTKGRYALSTLIDIAKNQDENSPVSIKEMAERQGISLKYLEQIISLMVKGKLLKSILVGEILNAAEGTLAPVDCVRDGVSCEKSASCPTFPLYKEIEDAIYSVVNRYTLWDLVKSSKA